MRWRESPAIEACGKSVNGSSKQIKVYVGIENFKFQGEIIDEVTKNSVRVDLLGVG
jgi:hypothetical protein